MKYNFYCRCPLKHKVSLDRRFIGRRIPILLLGKYKGFILFPVNKGNEHDLFEPQIEGVNSREKCGDCSVSYPEIGYQILHPHFNSICFVLKIEEIQDNKIVGQVIGEIERLTSKFVKCISLIKQRAIRWSLARDEEYVEAIIKSYRHRKLGDKGWIPLIHLEPYGVIESTELTIDEFWKIFKNISKNISLQYELLADTIQCGIRHEYREAILNCSTIIEKTLKEQIAKYLDSVNTVEIVKNQILDSADGFRKILMVMKKFGLMVDNCNAIEERTIKVRNRIIHGGYFPTNEQTSQAIEDAKLIITQYNVPIFID